MSKYTVIAREGNAKSAHFETVHGTVELSVFMNVCTAAAMKGGVSTDDLHDVKTQIVLSNTYQFLVRPVDS